MFDVLNEGTGLQYRYLLHEPGKQDPSDVISMLHDPLVHQAPCLSDCSLVRLNVDSCSSQNKNILVVAYLKGRVAAGKHEQVLLTFMLKCYTRFSIDAGFGNNRTTLKKYDFTCLRQLMDVLGKKDQSEAVNFMEKP